MATMPVEQIGESTTGDAQKSTPFLTKTYQMVEDSLMNDIISWNEDGSTFIVWRPIEFARDLLPKYFKHNNFSSFVRQLNTYGFRKIVPDRWEFANDCFRRGEKKLLCDIRRRKISPATVSATVTATTKLQVARTRSSSNSGEEQVISSNSSPSPIPYCDTDTAELLEENDRLRKENMELNQELNQLKKLCNNIVSLMDNYAINRRENGDKTIELLPAKRFSDKSEKEVIGVGQRRVKEEDESLPRLFGVSIGCKRMRKIDDEEEEEYLEYQKLQPGNEVKSEPLDSSSKHQDPPMVKYSCRSN